LLVYAFPFLSFPFLFFNVFFAHWAIFAVVSTGFLCVLFPTIATWLWPAGESGFPSSLILFSFLVLSFYDIPFLSFPSTSFLPIDLFCCSLHGHSMCVFFSL
jgi:hypothetical protein